MTNNQKDSFFDQVYTIVAKIPYGRVISYGQIARMLGSPRGARTVGWALSTCPEGLPWQRVVKADGYIAEGEFAELRRAMLLEEGVPFLTDNRVDMAACEWDGSDFTVAYKKDVSDVVIRAIEKSEYQLLEDFLYNAIYLPPGAEPVQREIIFKPEIYVYIEGFGGKDDCGMVAEQGGEIIGAAWTRIIQGYGHIDDDTPELAISVLSEHRNEGVGTMLMTRLFEELRKKGYEKTSLSVQKDNPAVRFYERLGYLITGERTDGAGNKDYLMIKEL